jgi:hypothetical protein
MLKAFAHRSAKQNQANSKPVFLNHPTINPKAMNYNELIKQSEQRQIESKLKIARLEGALLTVTLFAAVSAAGTLTMMLFWFKHSLR